MEESVPEKQESALEKLSKLQSIIADITVDPGNDCAREEPEVARVNTMFESKKLKQIFINFSSNALFLEQFVKPMEKWIQEEEVTTQVEEVAAMAAAEEKKYKEVQEKENAIIATLMEIESVIKDAASLQSLAQEVNAKKAEYKERCDKVKEQFKVFGEGCKNQEDVAKVLQKQREQIIELKNKLLTTVGPVGENMSDTSVLDILLSSINLIETQPMISPDSMESMDEDPYETYSGVKLISSDANSDILEVFYTNSDNARLSVEVRVKYDSSRDVVTSVSVTNSPIDVSDLIKEVSESNDFKCFVAEFQYRLYNI